MRKVRRHCHYAHIICAHLMFHAMCGFVEYHITDIAFHFLTGTDATTYVMHVVLHILV